MTALLTMPLQREINGDASPPISHPLTCPLRRKGLHGCFQGTLGASCQRRLEGLRIKHWMQGKLAQDGQQGPPSPARRDHHCTRRVSGAAARERARRRTLAWQPLRKGVADLHRRARFRNAPTSATRRPRHRRRLDAAASAPRPGCPSRALSWPSRPGLAHWRCQDLALLQAISRGEFALAGFP